MVVQAVKGWTRSSSVHYLLWYLLPQTLGASLLAVLAVFVQTLVPHKMIGWAVMLAWVVSTLVLTALGFEHNLYQYAGTPEVPLSDMNGQGHYWVAAAWFQAYWCAFALVLVVLAYGPAPPRCRRRPAWRLAAAAAAARPGRPVAGGRRPGLGGPGRLDLLQHQRAQPLRDAARARGAAGPLRKGAAAVREAAAADHHRRHAEGGAVPPQRRAATTGSYRIENRTARRCSTCTCAGCGR
jgi:ABC-2 type transport system permease protein